MKKLPEVNQSYEDLFKMLLAPIRSKLASFLVAPFVLNILAAFIFYSLMRSAIGKLVHGAFSGTNLIPIPGEPWGFVWGICLCIIAGFASLIPLTFYYWEKRKL